MAHIEWNFGSDGFWMRVTGVEGTTSVVSGSTPTSGINITVGPALDVGPVTTAPLSTAAADAAPIATTASSTGATGGSSTGTTGNRLVFEQTPVRIIADIDFADDGYIHAWWVSTTAGMSGKGKGKGIGKNTTFA